MKLDEKWNEKKTKTKNEIPGKKSNQPKVLRKEVGEKAQSAESSKKRKGVRDGIDEMDENKKKKNTYLPDSKSSQPESKEWWKEKIRDGINEMDKNEKKKSLTFHFW